MAQGCLRGCLYEAMPVNQEMEQAILEHVKLDKNIEEIMKMVLLTKEECKVTESGRRPSSFLFSYTLVLKNSYQHKQSYPQNKIVWKKKIEIKKL